MHARPGHEREGLMYAPGDELWHVDSHSHRHVLLRQGRCKRLHAFSVCRVRDHRIHPAAHIGFVLHEWPMSTPGDHLGPSFHARFHAINSESICDTKRHAL